MHGVTVLPHSPPTRTLLYVKYAFMFCAQLICDPQRGDSVAVSVAEL